MTWRRRALHLPDGASVLRTVYALLVAGRMNHQLSHRHSKSMAARASLHNHHDTADWRFWSSTWHRSTWLPSTMDGAARRQLLILPSPWRDPRFRSSSTCPLKSGVISRPSPLLSTAASGREPLQSREGRSWLTDVDVKERMWAHSPLTSGSTPGRDTLPSRPQQGKSWKSFPAGSYTWATPPACPPVVTPRSEWGTESGCASLEGATGWAGDRSISAPAPADESSRTRGGRNPAWGGGQPGQPAAPPMGVQIRPLI